MPAVSIPTSFNISLDFEVPGFGRRLVALAIDMTVQFIYFLLASRILNSLKGLRFDADSGFNDWAWGLIILVPVFLYHIVLEVATNGQSTGKKIMGIRVVSTNGGRPSLSQLLIRWLLRVSDLWVFLLLLIIIYVMAGVEVNDALLLIFFGMGFLLTDIILVAATSKAQRIGDMLAQTILIRTGKVENLSSTIFREVEADYRPMFPQVMRISDKDLNVIKSLLDGRGSNNRATRAMAAAKVRQYLKIETPLSDEAFLDQLLKDYNYLSSR
ncbi:RDD family protein [Niabella terrae]